MNDTPLTEARVVFFGYNPDEGDEFVQADFARDLERQNTALLNAIKDIALLTANGDAERASWVALGILNDPRAAIDAAR